MTTYTLSEARKKFSELIQAVQTEGTQFSITVNGNTAATIIASEDYETLLETIEILQDQAILEDIVSSEKEYREGKITPLADIA